jgi:hypothetical protein
MALIKTDSGCKVGWEVYDNEAEARARATSPELAADRTRALQAGYDFGYQWPGTVERVRTYPHQIEGIDPLRGTTTLVTDYSRPEFKDEWRVCIP